MSFLNALATSPGRMEELRHAWKSLSFEMLSHHHSSQPAPISPPLTPPDTFYTTTRTTNNNNKMYHTNCACCPPHQQHRSQQYASPTRTNFPRTTGPFNPAEQPLKNESLKRKLNHEQESSEGKRRKVDPETTACQVHGILSLPGCREPRYNITAEELKRRVDQPECLTKVDMISYVRLAKNSARTLLEKHDIKTNQHNQRSEHTVLSKMCEAECRTLASGIRDINYRYFPASWFAQNSAQEIVKNNPSPAQRNEAIVERQKEDEITKCVLLDIYFGLEKRKNDKEMNVFNLISHSFALGNLQNHILFLLSYIEEELRVLRNTHYT